MSTRNPVYRETAAIAIGEVLCVGLMLGIYALAGRLDRSVVLGGMLGGLLSICNFFFMAVGALPPPPPPPAGAGQPGGRPGRAAECEGRNGLGAYVLPAPVPGFVPDFVCGSQEQTV